MHRENPTATGPAVTTRWRLILRQLERGYFRVKGLGIQEPFQVLRGYEGRALTAVSYRTLHDASACRVPVRCPWLYSTDSETRTRNVKSGFWRDLVFIIIRPERTPDNGVASVRQTL
jgi:hypothetical protein